MFRLVCNLLCKFHIVNKSLKDFYGAIDFNQLNELTELGSLSTTNEGFEFISHDGELKVYLSINNKELCSLIIELKDKEIKFYKGDDESELVVEIYLSTDNIFYNSSYLFEFKIDGDYYEFVSLFDVNNQKEITDKEKLISLFRL